MGCPLPLLLVAVVAILASLSPLTDAHCHLSQEHDPAASAAAAAAAAAAAPPVVFGAEAYAPTNPAAAAAHPETEVILPTAEALAEMSRQPHAPISGEVAAALRARMAGPIIRYAPLPVVTDQTARLSVNDNLNCQSVTPKAQWRG